MSETSANGGVIHLHLSNDVDELRDMVEKLEIVTLAQQKSINEKRSVLLKKKAKEKILENDDEPLLEILRRKERRLKQELKLANDFPLTVEEERTILDVTLENSIKRTVTMSESSVSSLERRKSNLDLQLARVNDGIANQKRICSVLEDRVDELKRKLEEMDQPHYDDEMDISQRGEEAILKKKVERVQKNIGRYTIILEDFLKNNFPVPPTERVRGRSAAGKIINYLALENIIQILVNKFVDTPHDSYVTVDETWWPPYLEGLLRFDIAIQHPQHRNKVRLEDYRS